ncbi:WI/SNF-related matrix-associated actin-dependent regulator of chromatin subfamily B [Acrasis kona]|uniref:WI/SNF-related matrix-associated actin-dependent regulator of chromatin subfamily B n=1 Tax=Acrasis kona TaxID=1008807 RepID=A0AAW2Z648_9EUKA
MSSSPSIEYLHLIPIRIDLDEEGVRVSDAFLWSLKESTVTPQDFAEWYCTDYGLPTSVQDLVATSLRKQITNNEQVYIATLQYLEKLQELSQLRQRSDHSTANRLQKKLPVPVGFEKALLRIQLDVRAGDMVLRDQFEWDVFNALSSPENFAQTLCEDCQLELKWIPLVAHSIRESIYSHLHRHLYKNKKLQTLSDSNISSTLTFSKTFDSSHIEEDNSKKNENGNETESDAEQEDSVNEDEPMLDVNVIRDEDEYEEWEPHIVELGEDELEKMSAKEEREARYRRREFSSTSGRVTRNSARFM